MQLKMRQTHSLAEIEATELKTTLFKSDKNQVIAYINHLAEIITELNSWYEDDSQQCQTCSSPNGFVQQYADGVKCLQCGKKTSILDEQPPAPQG